LCTRGRAFTCRAGWIRARATRISRFRTGAAVRARDEDRAMTRPERMSKRPWSVPLALSDVPDSGRHLDLVADEKARNAAAKHAGLSALPRLEASFDVTLHGRGGLHVLGRVSATVGQTCVVTLEPLENEIDEAIDLVFAPGGALPLVAGGGMGGAGGQGPGGRGGGGVGLGAIASEFFVLRLVSC